MTDPTIRRPPRPRPSAIHAASALALAVSYTHLTLPTSDLV